jgi:hypothetical protein
MLPHLLQCVVATQVRLRHAIISCFVSFCKVCQWFDGCLFLFFWDVSQGLLRVEFALHVTYKVIITQIDLVFQFLPGRRLSFALLHKVLMTEQRGQIYLFSLKTCVINKSVPFIVISLKTCVINKSVPFIVRVGDNGDTRASNGVRPYKQWHTSNGVTSNGVTSTSNGVTTSNVGQALVAAWQCRTI